MKKLLFIASIVLFLSSCKKDDGCKYDECAQKAPASERQSVESYLQSNNITATQHCSGVYYVITQQGSGPRPTACGAALVNYVGRLTNGNEFDRTPAGQPAAFNMAGLTLGFKNALLQLKSGGKMTMYIPPFLGYGNQQTGSIPPNSILIFEVELLDAQ